MVDRGLLSQAKRLHVADRIELIGALWDTIDTDTLPVTPQEAALIDQRLAEADAEPLAGRAWDDVEASLRHRSR